MSQTTSWTQINVASISDIHLGCPSNPAKMMIKGLDHLLTLNFLSTIDVLFIVGDVFDRGLALNHKDVPDIVSWIRRLLSRCAKADTTVVVLEGTPSHDRLQSHMFVAINDAAEEQDKCELYYVKEVSLLDLPRQALTLLCIPDEKNTNDEITYHQVQDLMKARAIDKVDFGIFHGFFEFQVPTNHHSRFHDSQSYLDLVRYLIFIGHDHEFQQQGRIFVQGSPDRQRHGMESPKGMIRASIQRDGTFQADFLVNPYAMQFKTLEIPLEVSDAIELVKETCDTLPKESHLRIAAKKGHPVFASIDSFELQYPFIHFSKKVLDEEEKEETIIDETDESYVPFVIDSSNIESVVRDRLSISLAVNEAQYFEELIEGVK